MSDIVHPQDQQGPIARPPEGSSAPKTLGILSIVFGGLVTVFSLLGLGMGAMFRSMPNLDAQQSKQLPFNPIELQQRLAPYQQTDAGIMMIMSIALLVIGIGLVKYREAARKAAVVWAVVAFPVLGFRAWVQETKIWPITRDMMQHMQELVKAQGNDKMPVDMVGFTSAIAHGGQYASMGLYAIFPALLLILLNLASVKQSMRDR